MVAASTTSDFNLKQAQTLREVDENSPFTVTDVTNSVYTNNTMHAESKVMAFSRAKGIALGALAATNNFCDACRDDILGSGGYMVNFGTFNGTNLNGKTAVFPNGLE